MRRACLPSWRDPVSRGTGWTMLILLLQACVPYASPPMDLTLAVDPIPEAPSDVAARTSPSALEGRLGLVPLAVFDRYRERVLDPSAGIVASLRYPGAPDAALNVGGYARLAGRPWRYDFDWWARSEMGSDPRPRGLLAAEPRITFDVTTDLASAEPRFSSGVLVGAAFRVGSWTERMESQLGIGWGNLGISRGETGVALAIDGGLLVHPGGELDARFLLALELRLPASAGVVVAPFQL
jgi:hypothetical protein